MFVWQSSGQPQASALARQVSWRYWNIFKKVFKQSSIPQFSFMPGGRQAVPDHQEQKLWLRGKWKKKQQLYLHLEHENTENSSQNKTKKPINIYFQQNWGSTAFSALKAEWPSGRCSNTARLAGRCRCWCVNSTWNAMGHKGMSKCREKGFR